LISDLLRRIPVVLALVLAPQGRPDPDESLASAVERIVAEREPGYFLERREGRGTSTHQVWRVHSTLGGPTPTPTPVGGKPPFVQIQIFRLTSDVEARERLEQSVRYTQVSPVGSVPSLGETSYVFWSKWKDGSIAHESTSIRFRRANVMAFVSTDRREVAERFAFYVLDTIEDRLQVSYHGLIVK
jgi:hypothetical protein